MLSVRSARFALGVVLAVFFGSVRCETALAQAITRPAAPFPTASPTGAPQTMGSPLTTKAPALAQTPTLLPSPSPLPTTTFERWSIHAQATDTQQYHGGFAAAYSGPQSLSAMPDTAKTFDATLFLGSRLWKGAEFYVNPEIDQGFGLGFPGAPGMPYNGTFGVAGFVSGEAYKIGSDSSYGRIQRIFIRQTFNFGGDKQKIEPGINQLAGSEDTKHLTLTAGKFGVTDVFDNNVYAHDTKNDFLNWSIIDMGAFDYAADAWGYTYGVSAELASAQSTLRAGVFQLSLIPNQIAIEPVPFRESHPRDRRSARRRGRDARWQSPGEPCRACG